MKIQVLLLSIMVMLFSNLIANADQIDKGFKNIGEGDASYFMSTFSGLDQEAHTSTINAIGIGAEMGVDVVGKSAVIAAKTIAETGLKSLGAAGEYTGKGISWVGKETGSKGIQAAGNVVSAVGQKIASSQFWHGIAENFGAAPQGYVYSCKVYNDLLIPAYVHVRPIASFMGAMFPTAAGFSTSQIQPYSHYDMNNQMYYFIMTIVTNPDITPATMPYMSYSSLYEQDCVKLQEKNSTQMNYFRTYMGKYFDQGVYVHTPRAEYLGYADPGNKKDKGASVSIADNLSSLVLYNNTDKDLIVGYSSSNVQSAKNCDLFLTTIEKNSFALYSGVSKGGFGPGQIGLFDQDSDTVVTTFDFPSTLFAQKTYTVEFYQDASDKTVQIGLQGLMPGHYDMPTGRVRDVTPVTGIFWYQSAAQSGLKGSVDLSGQVWVVTQSNNHTIISQVMPGDSIQFSMNRPLVGQKQQIYFVYVDSTNTQKAQAFVEGIVNGTIGSAELEAVQQQATSQMSQIKSIAQQAQNGQGPQTLPSSLIIKAMSAALRVNKGLISDSTTGISGYLLGTDVFFANGVGASDIFYYQLPTSFNKTIPTSAVSNMYAQTLAGKAPKGMPKPNILIDANGTISK